MPCTDPSVELLELFSPLLRTCDVLFAEWYRQQHACNVGSTSAAARASARATAAGYDVKRQMTFITRYTPAKGEQALLKHIDGAGKVDGSVVVALPTDRWSQHFEAGDARVVQLKPEERNESEAAGGNPYSFEGCGGGLTFWDGSAVPSKQTEIDYHTRSGDIAFIDKAVWHQANPISKGTRWALVICRSRGVGVAWCGVVLRGVVWCGVAWCGVVWCCVVWCGVVLRGVVWCGVV